MPLDTTSREVPMVQPSNPYRLPRIRRAVQAGAVGFLASCMAFSSQAMAMAETAPASPAAESQSAGYSYCVAFSAGGRLRSWYSEVFRLSDYIMDSPSQRMPRTPFVNFLVARGYTSLSDLRDWQCLGPFTSYRQANEDMDNRAASQRREGWSLSFVPWSY